MSLRFDSIRPNRSVRRGTALGRTVCRTDSGTVGTNKQRRSEWPLRCTPQWPLSLQWSAPLCAAAESAPDDFVKKVVPVIQDRINRRAIRPATCCTVAPPCRLKGPHVRSTADSRNAEARSRAACCSTRVLLPPTADERYRSVTDSTASTMQRTAWQTQCGIPCSTG